MSSTPGGRRPANTTGTSRKGDAGVIACSVMADPEWYYRWSLIWSAFGAVGTIGAVVLALFGEWIRRKLFPPQLKIALLNREGEKISITTGNSQFLDESRYYHLIVSNSRRAFPATDLDVRLIRIGEPAPGGELRTVWTGDVPIHCRNQAFNPLKHRVGGIRSL
jgi:hypothetical protein